MPTSLFNKIFKSSRPVVHTTTNTTEEPLYEDVYHQEGQLSVDVYQTTDSLVIMTPLAGVTAKDLDITINNDMITIRGTRHNKHAQAVPDEYYSTKECHWGDFSRSLILSVEVDADRATAKIEDGILTIHLPKLNQTQHIPIQ